MSDPRDLPPDPYERPSRRLSDRPSKAATGTIIAALVVLAIIAVSIFYAGMPTNTTTTSNTPPATTAPAPSGSSGTVGQAPQNPGSAPANR
ncbi:hypothetical protein X566_17820 [Afipia sp. P52-10]|jgi:hypothetical protein|uniref:hypothetical protein n=1 Tax=Afipia sp. P52-10 TaxID=1429916 RepID=UPI0003DF1817|nr:hypothetical protein [Afipia sp. P52-10]ETR76461.1 hypothetical protein X566_17820 [Afipia sp. P52-10]